MSESVVNIFNTVGNVSESCKENSFKSIVQIWHGRHQSKNYPFKLDVREIIIEDQ